MATDVSLASTASSLLSGSIKWTGLASGTDFDSVVDQLIAIEETQSKRLETWKATWENKVESIEGLNSRMESLLSYVEGLDEASEFYARTSTSSNTSVVTVTNTSSAEPGSHTVIVGGGTTAPTGFRMVASRSFKDGEAIGGTSPLIITVDSQPPFQWPMTRWSTISTPWPRHIDAADTAICSKPRRWWWTRCAARTRTNA
jgi:hypothetical protein